jgi:hypothetical protein
MPCADAQCESDLKKGMKKGELGKVRKCRLLRNKTCAEALAK